MIFGQLLQTFGDFFWSHWPNLKINDLGNVLSDKAIQSVALPSLVMFHVPLITIRCFQELKSKMYWTVINSVTRFGEVSPIQQKCASLWQIFNSLYFLYGKMMGLLWQMWNIIGLVFIVVNGQISKNYLDIWSHWLSDGQQLGRF